MIVGFSRHGTGDGAGPVDYMTDPNRTGRENAPPIILRGDPEDTRQLIDSLDFKHKYTSGVLSFAPGEHIDTKTEQNIIDRFEQFAFAGLANDQYNILWVRHTHAGHHELHFVTPRVELSTSKSLNIKPPGKNTQQHFDNLRSEINARYGLADPTDPNRARNVSIPDHELKIASQAIRNGQEPPDNMRQLIDQVLSQQAAQGLINNRDDLLNNVKELGLEVTRAGKDYITVKEPEHNKRWRLKGGLYARDYEPSRAIKAASTNTERDYSKPDPRAAEQFAQRVEQHIASRADYHQKRYPKPEPAFGLDNLQKPPHMADDSRPRSLSRSLHQQLGDDAIPIQTDYHSTEQPQPTGRTRDPNAGQHQEPETSLERTTSNLLWEGEEGLRSDRSESRGIWREPSIQNFEGTLNDRTRNTLVECLKDLRAAVQRTVSNLKAGARSLAQHVQSYFTREHLLTTAGTELKQASHQLERSTPTVQQALQREQNLNTTRKQPQREPKKAKQTQSKGWDMEM